MAFHLRAQFIDVGLTVLVASGVAVAIGIGAKSVTPPVGLAPYLFGVLMALPVLGWRRWPLGVLLVSSALQLVYYFLHFPGIPPSPILALPLYAAALAGRLAWAIVVPGFFYSYGFFDLAVKEHQGWLNTFGGLLPPIALAAVTVLLGEVVRSRRALAEETRERLRQAESDRQREAAQQVAEERVRIARELHDTVAHSMATIAVQAGGALHVLGERPKDVEFALKAIRDTSKGALQELRATLGILRDGQEPEQVGGLDRLPALLDAVRAAGVPVTMRVTGRAVPLNPPADHSAYRILQESLTNVLRHAGPQVKALITMVYDPYGVAIEVTDDGVGAVAVAENGGGHGLGGMRERAEAVGGTLTAGPRPDGGFVVSARLPT